MTTSIGGTTGITFNDASVQATAATGFGFKNRIINGNMGISQRGTSFSTPAIGAYTLDRWYISWGGAAPATVAQIAGPNGFRNSLQITGAASNTYTQIVQRIESLNCSDLSGQTITIQANITVSSAQTIAWFLFYPSAQDNYTSTTVIASGTWSATSTATTFTATVTNLPSGVTNGLLLGIAPNNNGAFTSGTFSLTGVQLEKGSTATSFDYRPFGTEMALAQRYYLKISNSAASLFGLIGQVASATTSQFAVNLAMRTTPTCIASNISVNDTFANSAVSAVVATTTNVGSVYLTMTQAAGLAASRAATLIVLSGSGYLDMSAEL